MDIDTALRTLIREVVQEELAKFANEIRATPTPPVAAREDEFLDVKKAAKLVGLHQSTIRTWIKSGRLKSYRAGRVYRLRVADVRASLERQNVENAEEWDADKAAAELLRRAEIWGNAKAEVLKAARKRREKINHHEVTRRTREMLQEEYGRWPLR